VCVCACVRVCVCVHIKLNYASYFTCVFLIGMSGGMNGESIHIKISYTTAKYK